MRNENISELHFITNEMLYGCAVESDVECDCDGDCGDCSRDQNKQNYKCPLKYETRAFLLDRCRLASFFSVFQWMPMKQNN